MNSLLKSHKNKNGNYSYPFSKDNYNAGYCGYGHALLYGDINQGDVNYDAARKNVGVPWMMPTKNQVSELKYNTTYEWTTIDGVNGMKFINKTNSSKRIFIPAGGWFDGSTNSYTGSYGYYWITNIWQSDDLWSYCFYIYNSGIDRDFTGYYRYRGKLIRGVNQFDQSVS